MFLESKFKAHRIGIPDCSQKNPQQKHQKKKGWGEEKEIIFSHAGILESIADSTQHSKQTVYGKARPKREVK